MTTYGMPRNAMNDTTNPISVASCSGACENDDIASRAIRISVPQWYLVSPA